MHKIMGVDIETYSSNDLISSGVYKYVEAPDFEILIIGFKFDDEDEVRQIDLLSPTRKSYEEQHELKEFRKALYDPNIIKTAFNANFERTCLEKWTGREMPPEQWSDTMIMALELGLPRSLADVGMALGLPEDKLKDPQGKALIRFFSVPCKPTKANGGRTRNMPEHDPEKWQLYLKYNMQDVVTEQEIRSVIERKGKFVESEQKLWCLDQKINDHGVRCDVDMVENIVEYDEYRKAELMAEAKEITGLSNPNSLAQLKEWLKSEGVEMKSVTKDTVAEALNKDIPDEVKRVLRIRQALGKTSTAKYSTMLAAVCEDDRIRGTLQYYGANRSGRWSGRLVQTHNLARNTLPDLDLARELVKEGDFDTLQTLFGEASFVFSELVRTAFIPSEDCRFVVSDFAAIEARVISWLSGEKWRLEAFREGKDIYCETASQMYHVPVIKHGENGHLRAKGKVAELACGYQGGVGAMKQMDKEGKIPEDELQSIVDGWRNANKKIVKLWNDYNAAAILAIEECREVKRTLGVSFAFRHGNLYVTLPSGRKLCYWGAKIGENRFGSKSITYKGMDQTTHKWADVETYGGKLVENVVQATARDCLAEAMKRVSAKGYNIVMHIHDEMVVDVPTSDTAAPEIINDIMSEPIDWAEGLPLKGDTYETNFYKKD